MAEAWALDKELVLIVVNTLIAIAGFAITILIGRLTKAIDRLTEADKVINERITAHREDTIRTYVRTDQMDGLKNDVIGRVNRLEGSFKEALMQHEYRERENLVTLIKTLRT